MRTPPTSRSTSGTSTRACVVCGANDARHLTTTRLSTGAEATVCGNHELAHRRSSKTAASADELRRMLQNRRERTERRGAIEGDELALQLVEAFTGERRAANDRRR